MSNRTNFVKVENLPPFYNSGQDLVSHFSPAGDLQDVTAVDPTTVVLSFMMRTGAENAVFAMDGSTLGGNVIRVTLYFTHTDPQFHSNPAYQGLGQYIGKDQHRFDPAHFRPWGQVGPQSARQLANLLPGPGFVNSLLSASNLFPTQSQMGVSNSPAFPIPSTFSQIGASNSPAFPHPPTHSQMGASSSPAVSLPPTLSKYTEVWSPPQGGSQDECAICLCELGDIRTYNKDDPTTRCLSLSLCKHTFHQACLEQLLSSTPTTFLQCPVCKKVHGVKQGTMPTSGNMKHRLTGQRLPGHEKHGCIEITFTFRGGVQGPEHPNPGQTYHPNGFPRVAFLPDSPGGLEMLHGLYLAWEQRVLFTVGSSITSGRDNCITWNDIHLKTHLSSSEHGYPDPHHLLNLAADLENHGVTQAAISSHMRQHPNLRDRGCL